LFFSFSFNNEESVPLALFLNRSFRSYSRVCGVNNRGRACDVLRGDAECVGDLSITAEIKQLQAFPKLPRQNQTEQSSRSSWSRDRVSPSARPRFGHEAPTGYAVFEIDVKNIATRRRRPIDSDCPLPVRRSWILTGGWALSHFPQPFFRRCQPETQMRHCPTRCSTTPINAQNRAKM